MERVVGLLAWCCQGVWVADDEGRAGLWFGNLKENEATPLRQRK